MVSGFAKQFAEKIGAEKVLVQKSGYYSRAAAANTQDRELIKSCCVLGVDSALAGVSGCVGHDEEQGDELRAIEFPRIKVTGLLQLPRALLPEALRLLMLRAAKKQCAVTLTLQLSGRKALRQDAALVPSAP
eukprot:SAG11_NODE_884_length_6733_cov_3.462617_4_plen_132_part_00